MDTGSYALICNRFGFTVFHHENLFISSGFTNEVHRNQRM